MTFNEIQYPFVIKVLGNLAIQKIYLHIIKEIYRKPTAKVLLNREKQRHSIKIMNKTRMSTLFSLMQYSTRSIN